MKKTGSRVCFWLKRKKRQEEAIERQTYWNKLDKREKLTALYNRGHSHCKQFIVLMEQLEKE